VEESCRILSFIVFLCIIARIIQVIYNFIFALLKLLFIFVLERREECIATLIQVFQSQWLLNCWCPHFVTWLHITLNRLLIVSVLSLFIILDGLWILFGLVCSGCLTFAGWDETSFVSLAYFRINFASLVLILGAAITVQTVSLIMNWQSTLILISHSLLVLLLPHDGWIVQIVMISAPIVLIQLFANEGWHLRLLIGIAAFLCSGTHNHFIHKSLFVVSSVVIYIQQVMRLWIIILHVLKSHWV
jgi:hypothetical protein